LSWQCFVESVQVVTQIATMGIAGFGVWIAYQTLVRTSVQEPEVEEGKAEAIAIEVPSKLKVFETKNQTTVLKSTEKGLECHLEDRRSGKRSGHQWTLTKDQIGSILSSNDIRVYPGYKIGSGVFSIGPRRNWLYSKKLFPSPELLEFELKRLLENVST